MIHVKRVYEEPSPSDGERILVDRLWPRGLTKEKAAIDRWAKEWSPSHDLRRRFHGNPTEWEEFVRLYRAELSPYLAELRTLGDTDVTLLYAAKDETHNNAVALQKIVAEMV